MILSRLRVVRLPKLMLFETYRHEISNKVHISTASYVMIYAYVQRHKQSHLLNGFFKYMDEGTPEIVHGNRLAAHLCPELVQRLGFTPK